MTSRMALSTVFAWCVCIVAAADCSKEQGNSEACVASADISSLLQSKLSLDGEEKVAGIASYSASESDVSTVESSVEGVHAWLGQEEDQSQILTVTFKHQGTEHAYELLPHSVYKEDAQVFAGSELLEMEAPRTYRARDDGKWVSMTLHEDGTVRGLFEDDGRVMEIKPVAHEEPEVAASLLQDYEGDAPAHLIRWVGAPDLTAKASLVQTDGSGDKPKTADGSGDKGHIPTDNTGGKGARSEETAQFGASSAWGGVKWFPGCYSGDKDPHEFIVGFAADKAASDKEGSTSALKSKLDSVVNEASFVYEKQLNIKLKLSYLKMDPTGSTFGSSCPSKDVIARLDNVRNGVGDGTLAEKGSVHLWTGCGGKWGVLGVAYVGTMCGGKYATGANKIHGGSSPWLTYAHELGHNFAGKHSFEDGQGRTGGVMDYGDGKLNGHYQFNTKYRKTEMCNKMNQVVNNCKGCFQKDTSAAPTSPPAAPTSPPAAPTTTTTTAAPTTAAPTPSPTPPANGGASTCGFEDATSPYCGMWSNDPNAKGSRSAGSPFVWLRKSGRTPSSGTGPSSAYEGSHYMYIETSYPRRNGDVASLSTQATLLQGQPELKFRYHMYGKTTGSLKVKVDGQEAWKESGNKGNAWKEATVDLSQWSGQNVKISLDATRGSSWNGDIAIDKVELDPGTAGATPTTAAPTTAAPTTAAPTTAAPSTTGGTPPWPTTTGATPPATPDLTKKVAAVEKKLDEVLKLVKKLVGNGGATR